MFSPIRYFSTALEFSLVRCLSTALEFSSVHCVLAALEFSLVHCALTALGLTPARYEVGACCPLVALFLFVLADAEPCGECLVLR